jgi:hypothetical protein
MKRQTLLLGVLALIVFPAAILAVVWQKGIFTQPDVPALEEPAPPENGGPIDGERVPLEVAQARVPWTIPLPSYLANKANLTEAWVSPEEDVVEDRQVYLIYDNGLRISIWPQELSPDFTALAEPPFQTLVVHGNPGRGTDPGIQQIEKHGEHKYPGSVTWWENGLILNIYGDFPLEELQKVAESMPMPVWAPAN